MKKVNPYNMLDEFVEKHCRTVGCNHDCPLFGNLLGEQTCMADSYLYSKMHPTSNKDLLELEIEDELDEIYRSCTYCRSLHINKRTREEACLNRWQAEDGYEFKDGGVSCPWWEPNEETQEKMERIAQERYSKARMEP